MQISESRRAKVFQNDQLKSWIKGCQCSPIHPVDFRFTTFTRVVIKLVLAVDTFATCQWYRYYRKGNLSKYSMLLKITARYCRKLRLVSFWVIMLLNNIFVFTLL